jgi:deoxyadenosine/deoxycytidine kinase
MNSLIQPPDLLIYLRASVPTLVHQIQKGAENMKTVSGLIISNGSMSAMRHGFHPITSGKMLIIDVDNIQFTKAAED